MHAHTPTHTHIRIYTHAHTCTATTRTTHAGSHVKLSYCHPVDQRWDACSVHHSGILLSLHAHTQILLGQY